jgi:hypothetical protein
MSAANSCDGNGRYLLLEAVPRPHVAKAEVAYLLRFVGIDLGHCIILALRAPRAVLFGPPFGLARRTGRRAAAVVDLPARHSTASRCRPIHELALMLV